MNSNDKLGKLIIKGEGGRDAIHVAIAPAIAGMRLHPGQDAGIKNNRAGSNMDYAPMLGIVDPFLRHVVMPEEEFYICLYPNTITSLKHVWTHPSFDEKYLVEKEIDPIGEAKKWLAEFAGHFDLGYSQLLDAADDWLAREEFVCEHGSEHWRDYFYEHKDEFWHYYEIATGATIDQDRKENFFTCSC